VDLNVDIIRSPVILGSSRRRSDPTKKNEIQSIQKSVENLQKLQKLSFLFQKFHRKKEPL
jgi:hypothetical protein